MNEKSIFVFHVCIHINIHISNSVCHPIFLMYILVQLCSLACGTMVPSSWHREEAR